MKTQVTITMDTEVRAGLKALAKKAGTNFSNLLNMAAAHMVQTQQINFNYLDTVPYTDEFSEEDYKKIKKIRAAALADLEAGRNVYTLDEIEAFAAAGKGIPD